MLPENFDSQVCYEAIFWPLSRAFTFGSSHVHVHAVIPLQKTANSAHKQLHCQLGLRL